LSLFANRREVGLKEEKLVKVLRVVCGADKTNKFTDNKAHSFS
jgi:hypothetical protein